MKKIDNVVVDTKMEDIQSETTKSVNTSNKLEEENHPSDHIEEITALLKTSFPLLTLSLESMVDQILYKLKPSMDEDIYRLIVALLTDGVQVRFFLFQASLLSNLLEIL